MRLTLRTLLAYLDDTLESAEIKEIGQKVAESDAAQELIARIKQVTRRRRLTTPPATGPNARFDPNDVAEYLDGELPSDQVTELEKVCLESDVHLAEIAACHQILTLVLGEPALVPPTARERMYKLVHGREALPFRKAAASAQAQPGANGDEDILPFLRQRSLLRWVLPVAGLLLVVALGVALWQVLPERKDRRQANAERNKPIEDLVVNPTTPPQRTPPAEPDDKGKDGEKDKDKGGKGADTEKPPKKPETDTPPVRPPEGDKPPPDEPEVKRPEPPSKERVLLARYEGAPDRSPSILVHRQDDADGGSWRRIPVRKKVSSGESLVSLPGYASELRTDTGLSVLLRGHVREFSLEALMDLLMESAVVLHHNPAFDLDLTLDRGRIYVSNRKDKAAKVRLRFCPHREKEGGPLVSEVWDLMLEPGAEVGVDLVKLYSRDSNWRKGEEPQEHVFLTVLRGEGSVSVDGGYNTNKLEAPPGRALVHWDSYSKVEGPNKLEKVPDLWQKDLPRKTEPARGMAQALKDLDLRLTPAKPVDVVLEEGLKKESPWPRLLALYCLAAIDEVGKLVDTLEDSDVSHALDRNTAIFALRRWICRSADQGKLLYDEKTGTGVLIDKKYRRQEADTIYTLLHDFSVRDAETPETYEALAAKLTSKRISIAELAWYHLARLARGVKTKHPFDATAPLEDREKVADEFRDLIAKKKLPPPRQPETAPKKAGRE